MTSTLIIMTTAFSSHSVGELLAVCHIKYCIYLFAQRIVNRVMAVNGWVFLRLKAATAFSTS